MDIQYMLCVGGPLAHRLLLLAVAGTLSMLLGFCGSVQGAGGRGPCLWAGPQGRQDSHGAHGPLLSPSVPRVACLLSIA
eukprot:scaffold158405_cov17-Prasinocladus_malaysianus.AAC.1